MNQYCSTLFLFKILSFPPLFPLPNIAVVFTQYRPFSYILFTPMVAKMGVKVSNKTEMTHCWISFQGLASPFLIWPCFFLTCAVFSLLSAVFQGQCQDCKVGGPNLWACLEVRRRSRPNKRGNGSGPCRFSAWSCDILSVFSCDALVCLNTVLFQPCRTAARTSAVVNLTRTTAPCTHRWGGNWQIEWLRENNGEFYFFFPVTFIIHLDLSRRHLAYSEILRRAYLALCLQPAEIILFKNTLGVWMLSLSPGSGTSSAAITTLSLCANCLEN